MFYYVADIKKNSRVGIAVVVSYEVSNSYEISEFDENIVEGTLS